jgi:hypothetical protein
VRASCLAVLLRPDESSVGRATIFSDSERAARVGSEITTPARRAMAND